MNVNANQEPLPTSVNINRLVISVKRFLPRGSRPKGILWAQARWEDVKAQNPVDYRDARRSRNESVARDVVFSGTRPFPQSHIARIISG
jgi:hypothetical protein